MFVKLMSSVHLVEKACASPLFHASASAATSSSTKDSSDSACVVIMDV